VSLPVRTTPEAEAQIRDIDAWWRENRRVAPDLFLEELSAAFGMIADAPQTADCIGSLLCRRRVACCSRKLDTTSTTFLTLTS
jgi:hypothetical protein